ncbi:hypothetical protein BMW22_27590 (plasmid) [Rhizobium leguminosarum]|uniref:IstB-like ATP-binding domain-containing protein n=1 Tax=Rhizobium leguminosarum TaxID=384 RepID=A0A1L3ZI76_RHILE|nr:hypothetical protein BMW22_27590 [Rhizobium leguminosarum]
MDRLLHHSTVITIRGDSYRLREKRRSGARDKRNSKSMKGVSSSFRLRGQIFTSLDRAIGARTYG